ncbi:MAG: transporter substrate-binding domain-containing protein [Anaerolineae bacterium]|nr:transporter substrate-binding domain-containing protein [Anaerolineae bacterium]
MVFVAAAALTLILSACGSPTPTATVAPTAVPPTNTAPAATTPAATTPAATTPAATTAATSDVATSAATSAVGGATLAATGAATAAGTTAAAMTFPLCAPSASLAATGAATMEAASTLSATAGATSAATSQSALVSRVEALRIGVVAVDACGVRIVELPAGGIASVPQLLVDDVIVAVDGKALTGSDPVVAFTTALAAHQPNDQVMLTVQRMGQEVAVTVTMGGGPASTSGASGTMSATAGATMAATTAAAAGHLAAPAQSTATPVAQETAPATKPATLRECAASGVLRVGSDASYPPFENVNEQTGKVEGFDVDLITAIGQKEGFQVDVRNALFDTIFTALSYGQYDLVLSAATITDERKQTVNFSNPYFVAGQVIVVRKADVDKIKTPADLAGKNVGVQLGTTGAEAAKGIKNVKSVKEYPTAPEAFQALANGDLDAVVNDNVTSLSIILNSPKLNLVVTGTPFTEEYYGIAVRKDCTALLDKVNKGLAEVIADGTYAKIYAQYLGEEPGAEFRKGGKGIVPSAEAAGTAAATMAATAAK